MASRKFNGVLRTPHYEPCLFCFTFAIDGASAVGALSSGIASYLSVSKPAGTGIYRVTMTDPYQAVLWADANVLKAAGTFDGDMFPVAKAHEGDGSNTTVDFQIRKTSDGSAQDITSVTVFVNLVLRNSQVTP